jgi:hypothetical protein
LEVLGQLGKIEHITIRDCTFKGGKYK